jgi:hypothetical protein
MVRLSTYQYNYGPIPTIYIHILCERIVIIAHTFDSDQVAWRDWQWLPLSESCRECIFLILYSKKWQSIERKEKHEKLWKHQLELDHRAVVIGMKNDKQKIGTCNDRTNTTKTSIYVFRRYIHSYIRNILSHICETTYWNWKSFESLVGLDQYLPVLPILDEVRIWWLVKTSQEMVVFQPRHSSLFVVAGIDRLQYWHH